MTLSNLMKWEFRLQAYQQCSLIFCSGGESSVYIHCCQKRKISQSKMAKAVFFLCVAAVLCLTVQSVTVIDFHRAIGKNLSELRTLTLTDLLQREITGLAGSRPHQRDCIAKAGAPGIGEIATALKQREEALRQEANRLNPEELAKLTTDQMHEKITKSFLDAVAPITTKRGSAIDKCLTI